MRYLVITYILRPSGQSDEQLRIMPALNDRISRTANIIMDFKEKKVIKARMAEPMERDWDRIYTYYINIYPDVMQALEEQNPQDPESN
tara:strand:+ start:462 stop:725 length:264 start_codon:yes stop_codon:yes gene_type:complete